MITFHDPRGETATAIEPYALQCEVSAADGAGITVGLLANGFPDSEQFLSALGRALQARLPALQIRSWNKGNASIPAPDTMLAEIVDTCQVGIAAYGH